MQKVLPILLFLFIASTVLAQIPLGNKDFKIDYANPQDFEIGGISISGTKHLDRSVLIMLSGLTVGDKITVPGEALSNAIKKLWKQGLFSDVSITISKVEGSKIFLNLALQERPRLSKFSFQGVKKSEADDLREKIKLLKGNVVTENLIMTTKNKVEYFFLDKKFLNAEVTITQEKDTTLKNSVVLKITVDKKKKVKINEIILHGNNEFKKGKVKRQLKDTKQKSWNFLTSSKFIESSYEADKQKLITKYNEKGFRDARIVKDTVYAYNNKSINIEIFIDEGNKYYFRNITWTGNTKYTAKELSKILEIKKGDVYNQATLNSRLFMNPKGRDVSSLYLDDGYLFFSLTPVESLIEGDSIDMEMRIYEGQQARINKVTVRGNTKTNDHVIMREIRTKPGQLFSRADIIRSQRELAQLGFFDPEQLEVNPSPNPQAGTVDIEYVVVEKSSDQIELSGGWGGYGGVVGSLGVIFTNFSARNFFQKGAWRPLPSGDGQRLSIRAQSNGTWWQSYNASFTEPWLGGKKPNSFSISAYHSIRSNGIKKGREGRASFKTTGASLGLGRRLQWPDDYFTLFQQLSFQQYLLSNWTSSFEFTDGPSNTFSLTETLSRNSIDAPIYPRRGAQITLTMQFTPPYSLWDGRDAEAYENLTAEEKYKLNEFHKWKFKLSWFNELANKLVLNTRFQFGFLGRYNKDLAITPFERFSVGGSGLSGFTLYGTEIIALRGYSDNSLSPSFGSTVFEKFTFELRYPLSLNPSATIYGLVFAEAGNAWNAANQFKPFELKKSAGVGVRIFLPMFGLLGFDYAYGFDDAPYDGTIGPAKWQPHFIIGYSVD
ncbi:MAG TPA: outer membrane protein assembly factor BamA [Flavobacteriales bacterium]|nr:outer membrane protein assembly factor BamA [Flavobacteriales bacterium]